MTPSDPRLTVEFQRFALENGTTLIVTPVSDTALVAVNMLYRTGARDEDPEMTGLAHLMEHLMFSGTPRYPAYDLPIASVGGVNNAFTNQDFTNYYIVLPADQLTLAIDLETDRMANLELTDKSVALQKDVVVEEFRQRYLNQPYGDLYHMLADAAWKKHPYRWPTIGLKPEHIQQATTNHVKSFYRQHYHPGNLIVSVAGNVKPDQVYEQVNNMLKDAPPATGGGSTYPAEPTKGRAVKVEVKKSVPASFLAIAFPVPESSHQHFTGLGFLADILGQGIISRLHTALVREKKVFTRISAGLTGTRDPGLFNISGLLHAETNSHQAVEAVQQVIQEFAQSGPTKDEMLAVVNGLITQTLYKRTQVMNLALELAVAEFESHANSVNEMISKALEVTPNHLKWLAESYLDPENRIEIHYLKS